MDITSYLLGKQAGGSGGTSDYSQLTNKPSINSVTLEGNKLASDLGISEVNYTLVDSSSPFIFDGKKKGLYILNDNSFYYKITSNSTTKTLSASNGIAIYFTEDFNYESGTVDIPCILYYYTVDTYYSEKTGKRKTARITTDGTSIQIIGSSLLETYLMTSNQTISGVKTFSSIPKQGDTTAPTQDAQFTNKKYVDDKIGDISTILSSLVTVSGGE